MSTHVQRTNPLQVTAKHTETANNNTIDNIDQCPVKECKTPMRVLSCNGIDAFVCLTHRIALPTKDA